MSGIKHPMSFVYLIFPWKCQKSSIPKCQEFSNRYHFWMDFALKMFKKSSIPKCHALSIRYHFYMVFLWKCQKKSSIPKCHGLSITYPFDMELSMKQNNMQYPHALDDGNWNEHTKHKFHHDASNFASHNTLLSNCRHKPGKYVHFSKHRHKSTNKASAKPSRSNPASNDTHRRS